MAACGETGRGEARGRGLDPAAPRCKTDTGQVEAVEGMEERWWAWPGPGGGRGYLARLQTSARLSFPPDTKWLPSVEKRRQVTSW